MPRISEIKDISPAIVERLGAIGITTTGQLLERAAAHAARAQLLAASGLDETAIARIVAQADLERVRGIAWDYAALTVAAGIWSVPDLASQHAAALRERLTAANQRDPIVKRVPAVSQIEGWIDSARTLPELVTYAPMEVY